MKTIQKCIEGRTFRSLLSALCLALLFPVMAMAQTKASGVVIDDLGEPVLGASIVEKGTTNGTTTDLDGNFELTVKNGAILQISFVGYANQEVKAGQNLKITLKEDAELLEETVVVGYGVQKKSSLTGAVSQVKSEDMEARTITDATQALAGKTAGVQMSGSASPGSSQNINIRGVGSNGSSAPLYVVDGRIQKSIQGIDPNDIESMEILKDGASAAIYGAAAGNGVILITTKKGKGDGKIKYDFQLTRQSISRVPEVMNSEQFIEYYVDDAGLLTREIIAKYWDNKTNTDWVKETFETGTMQRHSLTFQAGSDKGSIYISGSYMNNDGIVAGNSDTFRRLTGMINATWKIKPWLDIQTNNQISHMKIQSVSEGSEYGSTMLSALQLDPMTKATYTLDDMPDNMRSAYNAWQSTGKGELMSDGNGNYYGISPFITMDNINPLIARDSGFTRRRSFNVNGTTALNIKPIKDIVFTTRLTYRLSSSESYGVSEDYYGNGKSSRYFIALSASDGNSVNWQWENFINWNHTFNKDHNVGLMAGSSYSEDRSSSVSGSTTGSDSDLGVKQDLPTFWYFAYASANATKSVSGGEAAYLRKLGYFARASYDYKGKYLAQYNFRADAADSAVLPIDGRWGYFHGVSLGWTLSQEKWMESTRSWLDFLKVRASWGQNGSTASLGSYMYAKVISQVGNYPTSQTGDFGYQTGYAPSYTGNNKLKWETSEQTNIGIDARMLRNRLSVTADYFLKKTKDLIISGTTPSTLIGVSASPVNAGDIENSGFELELGWNDNIDGFRYGVRANMSTLKNKVTYVHPSLSNGINGAGFHTATGVTRFEVGHPAWYFRGYQYEGINEYGNPVFKDINGDGQIGAEDQVEIGKGMADVNYGITLTASWKGFDAIIFGTGAIGNDIYSFLTRTDNITNRLTEYTQNRWRASNTAEQNAKAKNPRANATDYDKYLTSSAMVFDGSYFKIKQIQLGYSLPASILKKASIDNFRVYCSLEDYFTFTSYPGFDPESTGVGSSLGLDKGSYPNSKKLVFGASITF